MTNRILDFSNDGAKLYVRNGLLIIDDATGKTTSLPFDEIAVIIASNSKLSYSQTVLSKLLLAGGIFVTCDEKHLPIGMLLPLQAHHRQTPRFQIQAAIKKPLKKRLWQQIVVHKICGQAAVLSKTHENDAGLSLLAKRVKSGDPDNLEAQAVWRRIS